MDRSEWSKAGVQAFASDAMARWIPRDVLALNPLAGVIDGFRWSICGPASHFRLDCFLISLAVNLIMVGFGITYFRKTERTFADVI